MTGAVDMGWLGLGLAFLYVVMTLGLMGKMRIGRQKELIVGSLRMTVQLFIMGSLLGWVFDHPSPPLTVAFFLAMEIFAIFNAFGRVHYALPTNVKRVIALSLFLGTSVCLFYFLFVVVRVAPWYNPRYFIPLGGMMIGNAMTGITLGVNAFIDGVVHQRDVIEEALLLGATPKVAIHPQVSRAFETAILPNINSLFGMGIVFLPGMMTGQILSGSAPLTAISYQIAIMLGVVGALSLSNVLFLSWATKQLFNDAAQLILPGE